MHLLSPLHPFDHISTSLVIKLHSNLIRDSQTDIDRHASRTWKSTWFWWETFGYLQRTHHSDGQVRRRVDMYSLLRGCGRLPDCLSGNDVSDEGG